MLRELNRSISITWWHLVMDVPVILVLFFFHFSLSVDMQWTIDMCRNEHDKNKSKNEQYISMRTKLVQHFESV